MGRDTPLRIFLSHTSELREHPRERSYVDAAESAVMRAGHAISNMAYFAARDTKPVDYCVAEVRRTDVFVGVIGMRYGSTVRDRPEVSYTELEFETASAAGIPRLILLVRDDAVGLPIVDQPADHTIRQAAFRRRLQEAGVTVGWVSAPADAELGLYQALVESTTSASSTIGRSVATYGDIALSDEVLSAILHPKADVGFWARCLFQASCDLIGKPDTGIAAVINAKPGVGQTSPDMIRAFRNGELPPLDIALAGLLAADADAVARLAESLFSGRGRGKLEDVKRRQFLGAMAGFVGLAGARQPDPEPWERLAHVLQHPKQIDMETVRHLEQMTVSLEQLEATVSPAALLGAVRGHFDALVELLQGVPSGTFGEQGRVRTQEPPPGVAPNREGRGRERRRVGAGVVVGGYGR